MKREKLDRANRIDYMCTLLDGIKFNCSNEGDHWNNLYLLCDVNNEFKEAIFELIHETKHRLQEELDKL
ncbi:hypothetical protein [Segatella hominis]|uniref:hypothetical protein n=1 Tax=Segatella hominis TaxID=2518605 RepID=UPI003AB930C7